MSKIKKQAALDILHKAVQSRQQVKEAAAGDAIVTGKPGEATGITSISEETETTNKNEVGGNKLSPQEYTQVPVAPVGGAAKSAEEEGHTSLEDLANELSASIQEKLAEAGDAIVTGKPGEATGISSVSEETETTDKNAVGGNKLAPQEYTQVPVAPVGGTAKSASSYDLGVAAAASVVKQAQEAALLKEAGRQDFELLITKASENFEAYKRETLAKEAAEAEARGKYEFNRLEKEASLVKRASEAEEKLGAALFDAVYKDAAIKELVSENEALRAELAKHAAVIEEINTKIAAEQERRRIEEIVKTASANTADELMAKIQQFAAQANA